MKDGKAHINLSIDKDIRLALGNLAEKYGVSLNFIIRRSLAYTASTQEVYWPVDGGIEARENKKYGTATPVYDGDSQPEKGRSKTSLNRAD